MMGVQQGLPSVGHRVSQWLWVEATPGRVPIGGAMRALLRYVQNLLTGATTRGRGQVLDEMPGDGVLGPVGSLQQFCEDCGRGLLPSSQVTTIIEPSL